MSNKRKSLQVGSSRPSEPPQDTYSQLIQSPREAAVAAADRQEQKPAAPAATSAPRPSGSEVPTEMTLQEIQAVPKTDRRPTNFALPRSLDLHRRMTLYKVDHDVQIQDQITFAVDRWLRENGY